MGTAHKDKLEPQKQAEKNDSKHNGSKKNDEIKKKLKLLKLKNQKDISTESLMIEFRQNPLMYVTIVICFFLLCYILSSYVLFPLLFKDRLRNNPNSQFYDPFSTEQNVQTTNLPQNTQNPQNQRFFQTSHNLLPTDDDISNTFDDTLSEIPPELLSRSQRTFTPLSMTTLQASSTPKRRQTTPLINNLPAKIIPLSPLVTKSYPHDSRCFTQGYAFHNGELFESCGLYNSSSIRTVNYKTGNIIRQGPNLPPTHFAEGLTIGKDSNNGGDIIYLLTWREKVIHRYRADLNWSPLSPLKLNTEGWGIAIDPINDIDLIISDGSAVLTWYDPNSMKKLRSVTVKEWDSKSKKFVQITSLNEIEIVGDEIWANVWFKNDIYCINPNNGQVLRRLDGSTIHPTRGKYEDVFNGIAFGKDGNGVTKLLVTGKLWSKTFELDWTQLVIQDDDYNQVGFDGGQ
jgi:glutaminyl-peptide cyclotransferase